MAITAAVPTITGASATTKVVTAAVAVTAATPLITLPISGVDQQQ